MRTHSSRSARRIGQPFQGGTALRASMRRQSASGAKSRKWSSTPTPRARAADRIASRSTRVHSPKSRTTLMPRPRISRASRQSSRSTLWRVVSSQGVEPRAQSHSSFVRRIAPRVSASRLASSVFPAPGNPQVRINRASFTASVQQPSELGADTWTRLWRTERFQRGGSVFFEVTGTALRAVTQGLSDLDLARSISDCRSPIRWAEDWSCGVSSMP